MKLPHNSNCEDPFPIFASLAEAEAYSDKVGDAYFEICYHLEGNLNLSVDAMHSLYSNGLPTKRSKMQTGVVRSRICPPGWPKHAKTLFYTLTAWARFANEDTCHAYTMKESIRAFILEKEHEGTLHNSAFNPKTFEPMSREDGLNARKDLLRLCDWIESRLHYLTHASWYSVPDCFSGDDERVHLASIGAGQRHLGKFSARDRKRWEGIHERAAAKHKNDIKIWSTVGKVQHDPQPRTWTHPKVDALIIGLWPLVERYNWTYSDLLNVLDRFLPESQGEIERKYPLDCEASLKMHCRTVCGLSKDKRGKSSEMPEGWKIAEKLFSGTGK